MAGATRNIRMLISQECFAFLAEAMCDFSKKTAKFQSLRSTVQHACACAASMDIARDELDHFLAGRPIGGTIRVWLGISPEWLDDYDALRRRITEIGGKPV
jgi:hypothetical protein